MWMSRLCSRFWPVRHLSLGDALGAALAAVLRDMAAPVTCKFCLRAKASQTASGVELRWRRPRGRECASCPNVLRVCPSFLNGCDNDPIQFAEKIAADPAFHATYLEAVNEWEQNRQQNKYTSSIGKTVTAFRTEEATFEQILGYVWPLHVYRQHFKQEPKDGGHHIQTIDGSKAVVLDASFGTEMTTPGISVYKMKRRVGVTSAGELANTSQGSTDEDAKKAFKSGVAALQVKAVGDPEKHEIKIRALAIASASVTTDCEGDDALLLEIWGAPIAKAKAKHKRSGAGDDDGSATIASSPPKEPATSTGTPAAKKYKTSSSASKSKAVSFLQKLEVDFKCFLEEVDLHDLLFGPQLHTWGAKLAKRAKSLSEKYDSKLDSAKAPGT